MTAKDIMQTPVITIHQSASLREAIALLSARRISGLPVMDDAGNLIGIVTEHDLIKAMLPTYDDITATDAAVLGSGLMQSRVYAVQDNPVSSIMTKNVVSVEENTSILKVASTMILKKVKRLPVVKNKKPVGIVSRIDVVQAIVEGSL